MIQRNSHDNLLEALRSIADHHSHDPNIHKICDELQELRDHFDIKTVFIGHYNAGKSSLINALLKQKDFLTEAQAPQTDICAELKYGKEPQILAWKVDGSIEVYRESATYDPAEYQGIHYTLPSPVLEQLDGYAIVDTPGFGSTVESHEIALSHYMDHGSVYLFVIDVEKGCIDTTTLTKIRSVYRRSPHIAVLFNKCDKYTEEQVELVISHAKNLLSAYMINCPVIGITKHDPSISQILCDLICSYPAQDIFDQRLQGAIRDAAQRIYIILNTAADNVSLDTFDYEETTLKLKRKQEDLQRALEQKSRSIKQDIPKKTSDILDAVRSDLESCSSQVASCLLMGSNQGAQSVIAESVRRTLSEAMAELTESFFVDVKNSLDFTGISSSSEKDKETESALLSAGEKFGQIMGLDDLFRKGDATNSKSKNGGALYKAITGTGALLAAVNPILEAIVIFLPEILQLCKKLFGESEEAKIRRQYSDAVIPQVISTVSPHVENCVRNALTSLLEQTRERINEHMESLNRAITIANEQKAASEQAYGDHIGLLTEDCKELADILHNS